MFKSVADEEKEARCIRAMAAMSEVCTTQRLTISETIFVVAQFLGVSIAKEPIVKMHEAYFIVAEKAMRNQHAIKLARRMA